jgi:methionyl-tRNA formyltransferase
MPQQYVIATAKPWNIDAFHRHAPKLPGDWHLIEQADQLTLERLAILSPRYIFFPHWSWRVSNEILSQYECVCFHMSDVPYGRGGSPLQNLIMRGHTSTMLTALRMIDELDAGPVYLKQPLSLLGSAEDIFVRAADMTYDLIAEIIRNNPAPVPQVGEPVLFRRRTPEESRLPFEGTTSNLCDFIRMLDAPTYPKAFLTWGRLTLEFDQARLAASGILEARVKIRQQKPEDR